MTLGEAGIKTDDEDLTMEVVEMVLLIKAVSGELQQEEMQKMEAKAGRRF